MMKTLDSPESFFQKNFQNFIQAKLKKQVASMLLVTEFATVS